MTALGKSSHTQANNSLALQLRFFHQNVLKKKKSQYQSQLSDKCATITDTIGLGKRIRGHDRLWRMIRGAHGG